MPILFDTNESQEVFAVFETFLVTGPKNGFMSWMIQGNRYSGQEPCIRISSRRFPKISHRFLTDGWKQKSM